MSPATEPGTRADRIGLLDAFALGCMHGPAELLPVSSSGHVTLVPWLTGMPYSSLPPERRKPLEIALHAGTAAALALAPPRGSVRMPGRPRSAALAIASLAPTAAAGFLLRDRIRTRLGTPGTVAAGLLAGSGVLMIADGIEGTRPATDLRPADAAAIGVAQVAALWPGVSRSAMAVGAARMLGFAPGDSARIARSGTVPASFAATALELADASGEGRLGRDAPALAVGACAAFASALLARPLVRRLENGGPLWPWALARSVTAAATLLRIRSLGDDGRR